jgi:hypothetical protein
LEWAVTIYFFEIWMYVIALVSKWYWNTFGMHFKAPIQFFFRQTKNEESFINENGL